MNIEIVSAEAEHIPAIAERVREADQAELWALACLKPYEALLRSWAISDHSWTAFFDGVPAVMFGVTQGSLLSDTGRPWLIGTDLLDQHPLAFVKECREFMPHIRRGYARLENHIDVRNVRAIRWLRSMRFSFSEPEPYGALKLPFMKFTMEK